MNKYILILRMQNLFTNNFNVKICAIYKKNKLYRLYSLFIFIFRFIPFCILNYIFNLFDFQIIYMTNNIYNITRQTNINIIPIILNFKILNKENVYDLTNSITKYSSNIPLKFVIKSHKITTYDKIEITILENCIRKKIDIGIFDIYTPIYKLFIALE